MLYGEARFQQQVSGLPLALAPPSVPRRNPPAGRGNPPPRILPAGKGGFPRFPPSPPLVTGWGPPGLPHPPRPRCPPWAQCGGQSRSGVGAPHLVPGEPSGCERRRAPYRAISHRVAPCRRYYVPSPAERRSCVLGSLGVKLRAAVLTWMRENRLRRCDVKMPRCLGKPGPESF